MFFSSTRQVLYHSFQFYSYSLRLLRFRQEEKSCIFLSSSSHNPKRKPSCDHHLLLSLPERRKVDRLTPLFFSSFNYSEFSHSANTTTTPPSLFRFLYNLPLQTHAPTLEKASLNSFFSSSTQVHSLTILLKSSAEKFWVSFSFFLSFTLLFYGFARCLLAILLVLTQFHHHQDLRH